MSKNFKSGKLSESVLQMVIARTVLDPLMLAGKLLWCHVPNGGMRNRATAGKLKAEGVKAGWPDIQIFWRSFSEFDHGEAKAIFIELKVVPNRLQETQKEMIARLTKIGFPCYAVSAKDTDDGCSQVMDILKHHGII